MYHFPNTKRHSELREKLEGDEGLKDLMVSTFLQGSYRRGTLIRPNGEDHADVDVVVVTRMNKEDTTPDQALQAFVPFLEKHYRRSGHAYYCELNFRLAFGGSRLDGTTPLSKDGAPINGAFFQQSSFGTYALATENNVSRRHSS